MFSFFWLIFICYIPVIPDGAQLPTNHRQHVTKDGTLTVDDATRNLDDGPYTCTASNAANQRATRTVFVKIMGRCYPGVLNIVQKDEESQRILKILKILGENRESQESSK